MLHRKSISSLNHTHTPAVQLLGKNFTGAGDKLQRVIQSNLNYTVSLPGLCHLLLGSSDRLCVNAVCITLCPTIYSALHITFFTFEDISILQHTTTEPENSINVLFT